ncbi:hypothetical protein QUA20_18400 [Microcoleus sp. Pol7_A1]|uniref:hypothetical protein n=1 Tax=Microcoleus sp. Pol7_A1 TaxID=2818893 RepID=UPI002FCF9088
MKTYLVKDVAYVLIVMNLPAFLPDRPFHYFLCRVQHHTIAPAKIPIAQLRKKENINGCNTAVTGTVAGWFLRVSKSLSVPLDAAIPPAAKPAPIAPIFLSRRSSRFFSASSLLRSSSWLVRSLLACSISTIPRIEAIFVSAISKPCL